MLHLDPADIIIFLNIIYLRVRRDTRIQSSFHIGISDADPCACVGSGYARYEINCSLSQFTIPKITDWPPTVWTIHRPRSTPSGKSTRRWDGRAISRPRCLSSYDHISARTLPLFRPATHKCGAGPDQNTVVKRIDLNPTLVTYFPKYLEAGCQKNTGSNWWTVSLFTKFCGDSRSSDVDSSTTNLSGEFFAGRRSADTRTTSFRAVSKTRSIYTTFGKQIYCR